jgi:hypothetical protein
MGRSQDASFFQYQKCGTLDHGQIFLFNSIRDRALKRAPEVHSKSFQKMAEKEVKETIACGNSEKKDLFFRQSRKLNINFTCRLDYQKD